MSARGDKMDGKKILYIEDNKFNARLVEDILKARGHNIIIAENGLEGIAAAEKEKPDIILIDIQLPGIDGYEVARRIKSDENLKHIPLIAVTSYVLKGDREKIIEAGCDEYIPKPINTRKFPAQIEKYLNERMTEAK